MAHSPVSGRLLASVSDDRRVLLWRSTGGGVRPSPGGPVSLAAGAAGAPAAVVSPVTSGPAGVGVVVTPASSPAVFATLLSRTATILRVVWEAGGPPVSGVGDGGDAVAPTCSCLLTYGVDGMVVRCDVAAGVPVANVIPTLTAADVLSVAPSDDMGVSVAVSSAADGSVRLFDWRLREGGVGRHSSGGAQAPVPPGLEAGDGLVRMNSCTLSNLYLTYRTTHVYTNRKRTIRSSALHIQLMHVAQIHIKARPPSLGAA